MKRSAWIRLLAVVLVCCIVAAPTASAAPYARAAVTTVTSGSGTPADTAGTAASAGAAATGSFWSGLTGWFRSLFGGSDTPAADEGVNAAADTTTTLKYFPVTLYNYDKTTINNATHQVEVNNGLGNTWNGIYFNDGNPSAESYTYSTGGEVSYKSTTVNYSSSNNYNRYINNGYYVDVDGTKYLVTGLSCKLGGSWWNGYTYSWTITYAGGTATSSDSSITLYKASTGSTATTARLSYAAWNFWNKGATGSNKDNYGQYTYSGLVENRLDANKNIIFTKPDGGIFNSDASVKDIYTNVEVPFVLGDNGYYIFDASQFGAYFNEGRTPSGVVGGKTSTAAQSNGVLYYDSNVQKWSGMNYGDGSKTLWAPFNKNDLTGEGSVDYHFGMRATVPFTMTTNGRLNANDANSPAIEFTFSGDDDVWIFIDGKLVIDLGGIHNRLDATINFAENTWSISESNDSTVAVADANGKAIRGTLFNVDGTTGILNTTRETFAATDSHELTIFYLERGGGSSNAQIKFNLPVKDSVSVKKQVSTVDSEDQALNAETLAQINNIDFGFVLTKEGTPIANTTYDLLNENGQYLETRSTDSNGHFTLRNGQTAKFTGEIPDTGTTYVVTEDKMTGWENPAYTYTTQIGGSGATPISGTGNTVAVTGNDETEDSVSFVCVNKLTHVDGTSLTPNDDYIVIDFGLPVVIDALANDVVVSGTKSIESVTGAQYGTATIDENGKIVYTLTQQLTGVEVLTYNVKATASNGIVSDDKQGTAKVYIIPATSMYYEENFSGLVTFTGSWENVGTAQTDPQEPGVVGTVGDSPYGSDTAYLNDSGDSNGSSMHVNTTNGAASFSYTFTGTGTSFFARTTNNSGYMRIVIKDADGNTVYTAFRDTSYKTENDLTTLYNIPVFTWEAEGGEAENGYGTYTVTVSIAGGANIVGKFGTEFWLDGIRVMNPLNPNISSYEQATGAYATDGEANMTVVTLRQKLIGEAQINEDNTISWNNGDNFVLFTDTKDEITSAEEYRSNGPKEEVYLNARQSVTFSLTNWDPNTNKIYLGIKAPFGTGTVSINGNTLNINNATDCYYDISNYGTITTDENSVKTVTFKIEATSSLISVTNIKVTGNAEFTIVNGIDENPSGSEDEGQG